MIKRITVIFLVFTLCFSMTACNKVPYADGTKSSGFYDEYEFGTYEPSYGEVEIDFWVAWETEQAAILAEMYMEEHPNVKINVSEISWLDYESKLIPALAAGTTPDIFECNLWDAADYATRDLAANLQNALDHRGFDESEYYQSIIDICSHNDDLYILPSSADPRVLYYNKDLFQEAGLDPEQPPETWEQLVAYCEKLVRYNDNGEVIQYGYHPQGGFLPESYWTWIYGGEIFDEKGNISLVSEETKKGFQLAYEIQEVQGGRQAWDDFGAFSNASGGVDFYSNRLAMWLNITFADDVIESGVNWGCAPMPYAEGHDRVTLITGKGFAFTDKGDADRLNAALDFGMWLCSYEQQVFTGQYFPDATWNDRPSRAHIAATETCLESYKEVRPQEYLDAIREAMNTAKFVDVCIEYPNYDTILATSFFYYLTDGKSLDDALKDCQKLIEEEINNYHILYD